LRGPRAQDQGACAPPRGVVRECECNQVLFVCWMFFWQQNHVKCGRRVTRPVCGGGHRSAKSSSPGPPWASRIGTLDDIGGSNLIAFCQTLLPSTHGVPWSEGIGVHVVVVAEDFGLRRGHKQDHAAGLQCHSGQAIEVTVCHSLRASHCRGGRGRNAGPCEHEQQLHKEREDCWAWQRTIKFAVVDTSGNSGALKVQAACWRKVGPHHNSSSRLTHGTSQWTVTPSSRKRAADMTPIDW
jgi:hypothetical protein